MSGRPKSRFWDSLTYSNLAQMAYKKILIWIFALCLAACSAQPTAVPIDTTASGATPAAVAANTERTPLVVFCAGSLIVPFDELEKAYEAIHPEIDILNECHGSIQVIRHVTELHEKIDVVATADHALIPMLMYETTDPDSGQPYAGWYVRFATNQLSLAHSRLSKYADEINSENWFDVISRPDVRVGIADPRFDAAGYRALMAIKLAEAAYGRKRLLKDLLQDQFRYPIAVFTEEGQTEIRVPEIVEPQPGGHIIVRGASIQLIALLESGDLDYAFEYESVIRQHNLERTLLPDAVNLGAATAAEGYGRVRVVLDFQRFQSVKPVFSGEPIGYGVTVPSNAPQPEAAADFVAYLLSPEGQAVLSRNYQPGITPPICDGLANIPSQIAELCASQP